MIPLLSTHVLNTYGKVACLLICIMSIHLEFRCDRAYQARLAVIGGVTWISDQIIYWIAVYEKIKLYLSLEFSKLNPKMLQTYIACHTNTVCTLFFVSTSMLEFISKIHIVIQYMKKAVFSSRPNTHKYVLSNHTTRLLNLSSVIIK